MSIAIVTPAESTMLTTVPTVREQLGLDADATRDALIEQSIRGASASIVRYCGRDFAYQKITETMAAGGGQFLRLSRFPLVTTDDAVSVDFQETLVDPTTYSVYDDAAGVLFNSTGWNCTYNILDYDITYWYGYILPSYVADSTLPEDLELAAIILSKNIFYSKARDFGIRSEEVPDVYKVMYNNAIGNETKNLVMTLEVTNLLDPYRMYKL